MIWETASLNLSKIVLGSSIFSSLVIGFITGYCTTGDVATGTASAGSAAPSARLSNAQRDDTHWNIRAEDEALGDPALRAVRRARERDRPLSVQLVRLQV